MFAVQINHPRAEERRAQISLAQALGQNLYHDGPHTFAVSLDGAQSRRGALIHIVSIPDGWRPGAAEPIGGWEK